MPVDNATYERTLNGENPLNFDDLIENTKEYIANLDERVLYATTYPVNGRLETFTNHTHPNYVRYLNEQAQELFLWDSEQTMRLTMKELLYLENEIIDSMKCGGSRAITKNAFRQAHNKRIFARTLQLRIKKQILEHRSSFKSMEEIKELLDYKRYMTKNTHIYGDYNENKIQYT